MNKYREIKATELNENVFDLIGHQWMLVTAGSKDKYNTMTASWGAGNMAFEEARLILECKKIYGQFLDPKAFYDQSLIPANFPKNDFHKVYIAEISKVWTK
jgi:hypothetical protein